MSRRQNRYLRRKTNRQHKRAETLAKYDSFENAFNYESLYNAVMASAKGVRWKESVQRYLMNLGHNLVKTRKMLLNNEDIRKGFIKFDISERGKLRHIKSVHFFERVIQKALCTNALIPILTHNLIYANSASQKGKGLHFATKIIIKHLREHYRQFGNNGYILQIDFKNYYDNINHNSLKKIISENFTDKRIVKYANDFVTAFGEKGLGLGSETSQVYAIAYPNKIDHFIKDKLGVKAYGRYMDDSYIIHPDKKYLEFLLEKLKIYFDELDIQLSPKKTKIKNLKHGFTFLKTRFSYSSTGKIIKKPCRDCITRERRKLKKQAILVTKGIMSLEDVNNSYQSWRGSMRHRNARKTIFNMDKLFNTLFSKKEEKTC